MKVSENDWWKIFTVVCLVSLVGLMEYQGLINLFDDDSESKSSLTNTSDEMHPL